MGAFVWMSNRRKVSNSHYTNLGYLCVNHVVKCLQFMTFWWMNKIDKYPIQYVAQHCKLQSFYSEFDESACILPKYELWPNRMNNAPNLSQSIFIFECNGNWQRLENRSCIICSLKLQWPHRNHWTAAISFLWSFEPNFFPHKKLCSARVK